MGIDPDVQPFLDVLRAEIALGDKASADQIAALAKELTAVKDRLAKLEQPTTPPPPAPEVIEAVDFAKNNAGHLYPGNLVGKGSPDPWTGGVFVDEPGFTRSVVRAARPPSSASCVSVHRTTPS